MKISVRLIPNAKKSEIVGKEGRAWIIRIAAPPVEGKANKELIRFLAERLDCAPSEIDVVSGMGSKHKILSVPSDLVV